MDVIQRLRTAPTVSVETAGTALGISRSGAYAAARIGDIPTIRVGHRLRVPSAWVLRELRLDPDEALTT